MARRMHRSSSARTLAARPLAVPPSSAMVEMDSPVAPMPPDNEAAEKLMAQYLARVGDQVEGWFGNIRAKKAAPRKSSVGASAVAANNCSSSLCRTAVPTVIAPTSTYSYI